MFFGILPKSHRKYRNGNLPPELFWLTVRKNCSSDREKRLKFEAEGQEFTKILRSIRTIYSNSERSEQFLVTECFFNFFSYRKIKTYFWKFSFVIIFPSLIPIRFSFSSKAPNEWPDLIGSITTSFLVSLKVS